MKRKILVTGACGYIGSHTLVQLILQGYDVVSVDNLCNSDVAVLDSIQAITGVRPEHHTVDLADKGVVKYMREHLEGIDGVMHFAALKSVSESVEFPMRYYLNNMLSLLHVLDWMAHAEVKPIIFSSSCTVYGVPEKIPVTEESPILPASSPYGCTKQIAEMVLQDLRRMGKIKAVSLRYFNPAGAHPSSLMGESPINPPLNLVPVITETCAGLRQVLIVYGNDYPTRDGSCIRDYIHVVDLAEAHCRALEKLLEGDGKDTLPFAINLGTGRGVSVLEAIECFERTNRIQVPYRIGPRRAGDVPAIYADNRLAKQLLGWIPQFTLEDIMRSAWEWELRRSRHRAPQSSVMEA